MLTLGSLACAPDLYSADLDDRAENVVDRTVGDGGAGVLERVIGAVAVFCCNGVMGRTPSPCPVAATVPVPSPLTMAASELIAPTRPPADRSPSPALLLTN